MPGINDKAFTKMWHDLKKKAGISSSPWYKKSDAAVSKVVESYQKARKKAGEPHEAVTEDIQKVLQALEQITEALKNFMDKKGLEAIKKFPPEDKEEILKGITKFKKEVADEQQYYNDELHDRLTGEKDVKEVLRDDAKKKVAQWEDMGVFGVKKDKKAEPVELEEIIKPGEKPAKFNYDWWRARKPKDMREDASLKTNMEFFLDHYNPYKTADLTSTDQNDIDHRINWLRQISAGLDRSEEALQRTIAYCVDGKHDNSKAALEHYLTMIQAYRLQRKKWVKAEKKRAENLEGLKNKMDEIMDGDPDY